MNREALDEFLTQARSEGAHNSEGAFTLDYSKARSKLASHQFKRPDQLYLKFVQAGVKMGAECVEFRLSPTSSEIRYLAPREKLSHGEFASLITDVLGAHGGSFLTDLAFALCGSQAESIEFIDTRVGTKVQVQGEKIEFFERGTLKGDNKLLIRLEHAKKRTPKLRTSFSQSLRASCQLAPIPISLDGQVLNSSRKFCSIYQLGLQTSMPVIWGESLGPGSELSGVGIPLSEDELVWVSKQFPTAARGERLIGDWLCVLGGSLSHPGYLYFVQHGVILEYERSPLGGVSMAICVDEWETDLSGLSLRQTNRKDEIKSLLRERAGELVAACKEEANHSTPNVVASKSAFDSYYMVAFMTTGLGVGTVLGGPFGSIAGAAAGIVASLAKQRKQEKLKEDPLGYFLWEVDSLDL